MGLEFEETTGEGNRGRMMQTDFWRGQLANSQIPSYKNQSVLILNQSSAPCAADKCDSLPPVCFKDPYRSNVYRNKAGKSAFPKNSHRFRI